MRFPTSFKDLIAETNRLSLYKMLVEQLNKDFLLANVDLSLKASITPPHLQIFLHETIYQLMTEKYADYINLLYIIDVSENQIKKLSSSNLLELSKIVSFLILRREWQKVWYRTQY